MNKSSITYIYFQLIFYHAKQKFAEEISHHITNVKCICFAMYTYNLNICHSHIVLIGSVTATFVWQINNKEQEGNALDFQIVSNRGKLNTGDSLNL